MTLVEEDILELRKDFPELSEKVHGKPLIYLDSAATALKPQTMIDTLSQFYSQQYATVHRAVYDLAMHSTERYNAVRQQLQHFFHAEEEREIIFTRGTTEAINLIATSFGEAFVQEGDEILVCEADHHSNIVPWQLLCQRRRCQLKVIPVNDQGEVELEVYQKLLTPRTKMVALSHVANSLGTIHPIAQMAEMAHGVGAKFLADGAQSAPHLPVDVQDLGVDFFTFSGHKLYGPTGIGGFYGRRELLEAMPPYHGGGDMIDRVSFTQTTFNELPLKFEAGTPAIAQVIALGASLSYVEGVGRERLHQWEQQLLQEATGLLGEVPGLTIIGRGEKKSGVISFVVEGVHHLDLGTFLDLQGVALRTGHHCTQPIMERFGLTGTARISFGLYTTREEIHTFVQLLKRTVEKLRR